VSEISRIHERPPPFGSGLSIVSRCGKRLDVSASGSDLAGANRNLNARRNRHVTMRHSITSFHVVELEGEYGRPALRLKGVAQIS
jgi:hypothetical protein